MTNGCIVLTFFHFQSQAKFSPERAKQCVTWVEEVTGSKLGEMKDQIDFGELLKDGSVLCNLINALQPGSVKKINTLKAPFKQVTNCSVTFSLKRCLKVNEFNKDCTLERKHRNVPEGLHRLWAEGTGSVSSQ